MNAELSALPPLPAPNREAAASQTIGQVRAFLAAKVRQDVDLDGITASCLRSLIRYGRGMVTPVQSATRRAIYFDGSLSVRNVRFYAALVLAERNSRS